MVVAVEARLLKKATFDKKFSALDQHKKIISMNDTVRVLEGPLEVFCNLKKLQVVIGGSRLEIHASGGCT